MLTKSGVKRVSRSGMTGFSPITLKLFRSEVPVSMLFSKILFVVLHPSVPAQSLA
jgi:hypothetical protein